MTDETLNLRNHLLIAMPSMGDPNFDHTVTLVCQHDEYGAFGVTINRALEMTVGELLGQLDIEVRDPHIAGQLALSGGPVQSEQGFVLHDGMRNWESTLRIEENLALTSSRDILTDIANGLGPEHFLLVLGCSGWSPGQLEHEIKENAWLTCPASADLLFGTPPEKKYQAVLARLGIDLNQLTDTVGHA